MSQSEDEQLLNDDEMKQMLAPCSPSKNEQPELNHWSIYCKLRGKKSMQQDYEKDLEHVGNFNTLQGFFGFHASIKEPSSLEIDTKIFYFLQDCRPFWEEWLDSGCLLITLKYKDELRDPLGASLLNKTWQFLLFGLVGNNLPKPRSTLSPLLHQKRGQENIIGLILSRRDKISLIQVWYRSEQEAAQLTRLIEEDIREHLRLGVQETKNNVVKMMYKRHRDSISTKSTIKGAYNIKAATNYSF